MSTGGADRGRRGGGTGRGRGRGPIKGPAQDEGPVSPSEPDRPLLQVTGIRPQGPAGGVRPGHAAPFVPPLVEAACSVLQRSLRGWVCALTALF